MKQLILATLLTASFGFAETVDFSQPIILSPSAAPGVWYTDRFPPNGFVSQQTAPDSTPNTLKETISPADHQNYAPGDYSSFANFQDTQGRDYLLPGGTTDLSINLYVDPSWINTDEREAGFWAEGLDASNQSNGDFPIIEFQSAITTGKYANGGVAGFYGWDNSVGAWNLITSSNFTYGAFSFLDISLNPDGSVNYDVNGTAISSPEGAPGDHETSLGAILLQGYNGDNGTAPLTGPYDIYWQGTQTPEPGTFLLLGGGLLTAVAGKRRLAGRSKS